MKQVFQRILIFFLILALILSIFVGILIGSVSIEPQKIWGILLHEMGFPIQETWMEGERLIIISLRAPRALAAAIVGAMLGIAGVAAQGLFRNPIAEPYIIGISSAAGFGTALIVGFGLLFLGIFTIPIISFTFALIAVIIVYGLSQTRFRLSLSALLLSGIALSFFFSAATSFILYLSEDQTHNILSYLMGSFWGVSWIEVYIMFCVLIPSTIALFYYARDLNLIVFGDETAQTTGVKVEQSKKIILFIMTILASTSVAFCGSIGFVGLIIPHTMRLIVGSDHRKLIPIAAIGGGILLVWADVISRSLISPLEIPVGIFIALLGGPFFVYLVVKRKKGGNFV
ncbi:MAG: hypothetical protein A2Y88_10895 [Chloroflexi bacterium RBG_13_48_10]|nr:MAG: hypothetical protein A2Y88_10895 [Chloroflexi bacterium RBG_13_48_10]